MSLATRCIHCGTIFKIVEDQLKVSEGWVRCGRCNEVFNALPTLFDMDSEAPPPRRTPAPPPQQTSVTEAFTFTLMSAPLVSSSLLTATTCTPRAWNSGASRSNSSRYLAQIGQCKPL